MAGARIHAAGEKVSLLPGAGAQQRLAEIACDDDVRRQSQSDGDRKRQLATGIVAATVAAMVLMAVLAVSTSTSSSPASTSSPVSSSSVDRFNPGGGGGGTTGSWGHWGQAWGLRDAQWRSGGSGASSSSRKAMVNPSLGMIRNSVVRSPSSRAAATTAATEVTRSRREGGGESHPHLGRTSSTKRGGGGDDGGDDDDSSLTLKEAATKSGFLLPPPSEQQLEKNPWMRDANHPEDLFLDNVLNGGANALPDVAPGVPFDADDPEYDAEGWAHTPLPGRNYGGGRNKFKLCVDHADQWDIAFPEGWFQTMVDSEGHQLRPGYCITEVVYDIAGSGCGDADVVLFNEGPMIWQGALKTGDRTYVLPPKHHEGVVYVYFAHESPASYGSELLDKRLMDQFDYLAYSNEDGSSLWWSFLPSARHLVQDFDVFVRPFEERQPVLGWLAIDCGASARVGILAEISRHYPVWSVGSCHNNRAADPDLPGRNMEHDGQRRRMQTVLSRYLFYFSAENSDCPGYTTEKLWMALSRGSVPVYFGDEDVYRYLPCQDCILDVKRFESVEKLAARMREIASNEAEYKRITAWRYADPNTWPADFRRGIAVASADVNRLTCSVLKEGTGRYKRAAVQVSRFGGYVDVAANVAAAAAKEGASALGSRRDSGDIYAVNEDTPAAVKVAAEAAAQGRQMEQSEVDWLRARACSTELTHAGEEKGQEGEEGGHQGESKPRNKDAGHGTTIDGIRILGKLMQEFDGSKPGVSLTPPESHYESACENEQKMACYRLKHAE